MIQHKIIIVFVVLLLTLSASAQLSGTYQLKGADTVKIFKPGGGTELVLINHTKDTLGFLFNTGGGTTMFKRALKKVNDTTYLVGADTLITVPQGVFMRYADTLSFSNRFTKLGGITLSTGATSAGINPGDLVDKIIIYDPANIVVSIGTTAGSSDIIPRSHVNAGTYSVFEMMRYFTSPTVIYFTGVTNNSIIKVFKQ